MDDEWNSQASSQPRTQQRSLAAPLPTRIAAAIAAVPPLRPALAAALDRDVTDSVNWPNGAIGTMERISNTPMPF